MSKKLDELFEMFAYNPQQKNQLRIADDKKLDLDKIKNPLYDWEQMREIAICMEYGVDPTPLCDPEIPSESMEEIRTHLFENQGVFEAAKEKVAKQRTKRLIISFLSIFIGMTIICVGYWQKEFILSFFDSLELVLIEKRVDIGLSQIKDVKYIDYVKSYNEDMQLVLPEQKIESIGEYTLHYELRNESKTVKKELIIIVYDDISPLIELSQSSITIEYGSSFNSKGFVKSATDNCDGDLLSNINIVNDVSTSSPGNYKVVYSVKDKAGNETSSTLNVTVKKKEVPSGGTNNGSNSSGSTQGNNGPSSPGTKPSGSSYQPSSKKFTIDTYDNFDQCLNACTEYINSCIAKGFRGTGYANPIKKDGLNYGYEAVFK